MNKIRKNPRCQFVSSPVFAIKKEQRQKTLLFFNGIGRICAISGHQHAVDDVDDAIRLVHIGNRNHSLLAMVIHYPD